MNEASQQPAPVGELFSRVYLERGAPLQDDPRFRNRLDAYLSSRHRDDYGKLSAYLKLEAGLVVPFYSGHFQLAKFFTEFSIGDVLTAITLIWRYLRATYSAPFIPAKNWHAFVSRALREENMGYQLDERCGVHYFVDEEFERNRASALKCLEAPRYAGVRAAFEAAHSYLDAQPTDTKASVRSAFESLEILARLMDPASKNLNKFMVENKLKPIALAVVSEPTEESTVTKLFDGLALMVDGLHNYRHGQPAEQPVAPSLTMAVYVISTVAAALRWLTALDTQQ
jgi:hypothetical protein